MQVTRRAVLMALRNRGWATVSELANEVGIKSISVRHHLNALQADGLVEMEERRQSVGRPLHIYMLSEEATRSFWQYACPYYTVARRSGEECRAGETLLHELEKQACLLAGDTGCSLFS
jgi:predicted ArsR family transcriptional regulator